MRGGRSCEAIPSVTGGLFSEISEIGSPVAGIEPPEAGIRGPESGIGFSVAEIGASVAVVTEPPVATVTVVVCSVIVGGTCELGRAVKLNCGIVGDAVGIHCVADAIGGMRTGTFLGSFGFLLAEYGLSFLFGEWARLER